MYQHSCCHSDFLIIEQQNCYGAFQGLPSRFEHFIVALEALRSHDKLFTFDLVKSQLLREGPRSEMRESKSVKNDERSALMSGVSTSNNRSGLGTCDNSRRTKYKCPYGGRDAHTGSRS